MCEPKNRMQLFKYGAKRLGMPGNTSKDESSRYRQKNHELDSYQIHLIKDEETPIKIELSKYDKGEVLLDIICHKYGIREKEYFGFRYVEKNGQMQWLNLRESVHKQLSKAISTTLCFRVRHYPGNPITDLRQDISRDLIYHQIRRDLAGGRILCPVNELATIGALILREKFGDPKTVDETLPLDEEWNSRFEDFTVIFNQTQQIEMEILRKYKVPRDVSKQQAQIEVLQRVSNLPTYGADPFPIKSITKCENPKVKSGSSKKPLLVVKATPLWPVYVGPRHCGLTTYVGHETCDDFEYSFLAFRDQSMSVDRNTHRITLVKVIFVVVKGLLNAVLRLFSRENIERLDCEGKYFIVYLKSEYGETQIVRLHCKSRKDALKLWRWAVDHWSFFTLKDASDAKTLKTTSTLFHKSHSYCFTGRTQMELKSLFDMSVRSSVSPTRDLREISSSEIESSNAFCQLRQRKMRSECTRSECVDSGYSSNSDSTRSSQISSSSVDRTDLISHENLEIDDVTTSAAAEVVTPAKEGEASIPLEPTVLPVSTAPPKAPVLLCTDIDAVPVQKSHWPYIETKRLVQELNPLNDIKATASTDDGSNDHEAESAFSNEQVSNSDSSHLSLTVLVITSALVVIFFRTSAMFSPFGN